MLTCYVNFPGTTVRFLSSSSSSSSFVITSKVRKASVNTDVVLAISSYAYVCTEQWLNKLNKHFLQTYMPQFVIYNDITKSLSTTSEYCVICLAVFLGHSKVQSSVSRIQLTTRRREARIVSHLNIVFINNSSYCSRVSLEKKLRCFLNTYVVYY